MTRNAVGVGLSGIATMRGNAAAAGGGGDPFFASVVALLHFEGVNGGTTFTDNSSYAHAFTNTGGPVTNTSAPAVGLASGDFTSTTTTYIRSGALPEFKISGPFTLEFKVKLSSLVPSSYYMEVAANTWLALRSSPTNDLEIFFGSNFVVARTAPVVGVWYSVAITRDASNVIRGFSNGVVTSSATETANMTSNATLDIGTAPIFAGAGRGGQALFDEFRFTNGVCRYTANYTPLTTPFPNF